MNHYTDETLAALLKSVEEDYEKQLKELQSSTTTEKEESTEVQKAETSEEPKLESTSETEFDYDSEDIEEMNKMYSSMSKSEAQAHLDSLAKTLGVSVATEDMKKSEEDKILKSENELLKSEVNKIKEENEELKKSLSNLIETLKGKVSVPSRKAITGVDYIAKSEETSKPETKDVTTLNSSEISKILTSKMREGKLEKSERQLVVDYYDKKISINEIKHLL
jgi:hypothetical protein